MKFNNLGDWFLKELHDLYSAAMQLVDALPKMQNAASNPTLKEAFKVHLAEIKQQIKRLEYAFDTLDVSTKGDTCKAMQSLISECEDVIECQASSAVKDAALIDAAQKIEHYEIAGFGTAKAHAKWLEMDEIAELLNDSLQEESAFDKKLTNMAEGTMFASGINKQASKQTSK